MLLDQYLQSEMWWYNALNKELARKVRTSEAKPGGLPIEAIEKMPR